MLSAKDILTYIHDTRTVSEKSQFSLTEAKQIGDDLGIVWDKFGIEQFRMGLNIELEHGSRDPATDITHDEPMVTGKIAWAHLKEIPDYFTKLAAMAEQAERAKSTPRRGGL